MPGKGRGKSSESGFGGGRGGAGGGSTDNTSSVVTMQAHSAASGFDTVQKNYGFEGAGGFAIDSQPQAGFNGVHIGFMNSTYSYESNNISTAPQDWGNLDVTDSGHLFAYYMKTSADGLSFSAKIPVTKNSSLEGIIAKTAFHRWGVDFTSQDASLFIDLVRVNWFIGTGTDRFLKPVDLEIFDPQIIELKETRTDEIGGANALINLAEVKSQPAYAGTSQTVWQGTAANGQPISPTNTIVLTVATTFLCDLNGSVLVSSQALQITKTGGTSTDVLTAHPTKPTITITPTTASITIRDLRITGQPIIQTGNLLAIAEDETSQDIYGESKEVVNNNYISQQSVAEQIAALYIRYYKDPRSLMEAVLKFAPMLQIGDRVRINSARHGFVRDFIVIEMSHDVNVSERGFTATTATKLWEVR